MGASQHLCHLLHNAAKEEYDASVDTEIKNKISYLSASYGTLHAASWKPVNYKDPAPHLTCRSADHANRSRQQRSGLKPLTAMTD
jgi:hypothetical protein